MIEKQKMTNKCMNPECNKEIPENKKYCDENCLKRHLELKKKPSNSVSMGNLPDNITDSQANNLSLSEAIFNLKDQRFQNGLAWRMKQVHAIIVLINNGWTQEQILREMRHNGLTELTARKIIEDATC